MTYAKKIMALLLVFCVVFNLTSAVFAEGEDEPLPDETVVEEEPAPEETEPPDEEAPVTKSHRTRQQRRRPVGCKL